MTVSGRLCSDILLMVGIFSRRMTHYSQGKFREKVLSGEKYYPHLMANVFSRLVGEYFVSRGCLGTKDIYSTI